jgi:hypothetical protein
VVTSPAGNVLRGLREDAVTENRDEPAVCCVEAEETGESHYHCANCGEVTGMFGHYNTKTGKFDCFKVDI